jgi:RNA-directed DNA polymerase
MNSFNQRHQNKTLFLYQDCDELKQRFLDLKDLKDVAELLNVSSNRLNYHISVISEEKRYVTFSVPKKSGDPRTISAPRTALKILQRKLSQVLYSVYEPKVVVQGFVPARSILTNAQQHTGQRFVLNIDLKDFFPSIHFGRVQGIFMKPPYNLPKEVAVVLAKICCYSGKLPQGAPTSPIVSNMICARMDSELRKLAQEFKCRYTRYADDITFSTYLSKFPYELAYLEQVDDALKVSVGERLKALIQSNGFEINNNKVRLQHKNQHQEVTGITVNKFPNVNRNFVRKISSMLHVWDKFGLESAEQRYYKECEADFITCGYTPKFKDTPSYKEVLRGKINYLGMIKGKENATYRTYSTWFYELSRRGFIQ